MLAYARNETECRSTILERYFGAESAEPCGICDVCLARKRAAKAAAGTPNTPGGANENPSSADSDTPSTASAAPSAAASDEELRRQLLERLTARPADPRQLAAGCAASPERIASVLRELLAEGKIVADGSGILKIIP